MALSVLNTKIKESAETINVGTVTEPSYCGWLPAERTRAKVILSEVKCSFPAIIQYTDGHSETELEYVTQHKIDFYIVTPKPEGYDVLTIMEIHEQLTRYVYQFQHNLSQHYDCNFVGERIRLVEQLTNNEAGIYFTLQIEVQRTCLT